MAKRTVNRGAYVRIQSSVTITVFPSLINQDVTNPDAHVPDRLKVNPMWPRLGVEIKQGMGWYPSEIAEWDAVKCLANDKLLTIGEFSDTCDDEKVAKVKAELTKEVQNVEKRTGKTVSLDEIANNNEEEESNG